jgi:hypothetical protein
MMKLKLTEVNYNQIENEEDLIIDGDTFEYEDESDTDESDTEENEHGRYKTLIYRRLKDDKYFRINVFYCRYGYKDYGFEFYMQSKEAIEVEKKEIVRYEWITVRDN